MQRDYEKKSFSADDVRLKFTDQSGTSLSPTNFLRRQDRAEDFQISLQNAAIDGPDAILSVLDKMTYGGWSLVEDAGDQMTFKRKATFGGFDYFTASNVESRAKSGSPARSDVRISMTGKNGVSLSLSNVSDDTEELKVALKKAFLTGAPDAVARAANKYAGRSGHWTVVSDTPHMTKLRSTDRLGNEAFLVVRLIER